MIAPVGWPMPCAVLACQKATASARSLTIAWSGWKSMHQCHGNRYRRAPRCQGCVYRIEQRGMEHRVSGPGAELWGPCCRTTLRHSDYAALARALGATGERVEKAADLPGAVERALQSAPGLVDVVTSETVVSSDAQKG